MELVESDTTGLTEEEKIFSENLRNEDEAILEQIAIDLLHNDAVDQVIELSAIPCMGTMVFKCLNEQNINGICEMFRYMWKILHRSLLENMLGEEIKNSVEYLLETLQWTVLPEAGLKIILQSEEALPPFILPEVLGPISKRCEKPTSTLYDTKKGICARCWNNCSLLNPALLNC
ncbi:uncharacterized protein LOC124330129 [Daphnia pulicaria]|uniref:uncharacterized protein LOC124330129 n=1 Tax=Daphnia pulicaria TaxID=35523 RepID=UPI001EE9CC8D|nr:uncharacterized protein LOC124330129 [Daphnia pulicaria]